MTEIVQPKRGGKAFHSILEPHFDFIREQRQRRKTWKEIAESLRVEKGIRVTLYAPYRFYRRQLQRRAKGHWEDTENNSKAQSAHPNVVASRPHSRPSPLPPKTTYKQLDISTIKEDQFT
jgi:hypothetical protein